MSQREILSITTGRQTSDGAGVSLTRVFGGAAPERFDPFLMLDEFGSNDPDEYIAGFPPHPHRGFETITYMLEGRMRHEDHMGNVGRLESGGVQWMTAARGVIHSEMPEQEQGLMRGFQLWLNLPAHAKLGEPGYRDFAPAEIPQLTLPGGVQAKVIAGTLKVDGIEQPGVVQRPDTEPQLLICICRPVAVSARRCRKAIGCCFTSTRVRCALANKRWPRVSWRACPSMASCGCTAGRTRECCWPDAPGRTHRAVRPLRDEQPRGDRAGAAGFPRWKFGVTDMVGQGPPRRVQPSKHCR